MIAVPDMITWVQWRVGDAAFACMLERAHMLTDGGCEGHDVRQQRRSQGPGLRHRQAVDGVTLRKRMVRWRRSVQPRHYGDHMYACKDLQCYAGSWSAIVTDRAEAMQSGGWHLRCLGLRAPAARRTSWPEKTGLAGPLPGKMQLLSVVLVAVLFEPYSDSGAMPDVTLVTSNSTYPA